MLSYDFGGQATTKANARREGDGSGEKAIPPQVQKQVPNETPIGNAMLE